MRWKKIVQKLLAFKGYRIHKSTHRCVSYGDLTFLGEQNFCSKNQLEIIQKYLPFTLTSPARMAATIRALEYVSSNKIDGAFVECGVWKGGQIFAGLSQLLNNGDKSRDVFLFDTFAGMTEPSEIDIDLRGNSAISQLKELEKSADNLWAKVESDFIENHLKTIAYPRGRIRFIVGDVRKTLLNDVNLPDQISVLRLDTDWYDSTYIELEILYPRLNVGGILLIDDYGHWNGARTAAEDYFRLRGINPFWQIIDYSCVLHVKVR